MALVVGIPKMRIDSSGNLSFSQETSSSPYPEQKLKWSNDSTTANGFYISQGTDRNGKIWHEQGLDIQFATNNTERMRILSSGGLTFNGDTAQANALDDYEEGYWTPTVQIGGTASSVLTVTRARYTKVGRKVTICCELIFTGGDSGIPFRLTSLPYNLDTTGYGSDQTSPGMSAVGSTMFNNLNISTVSSITAYLWSNTIYFYYTPATDGGAWTEVTGGQVGGNTSGGHLIFTVTYFTA